MTEHNASAGRRVTRLRDGVLTEIDDTLVVEELLEIRIEHRRFTVTMRTPGHDFDLARGLLFTEGVAQSNAEVSEIRYLDERDGLAERDPNRIRVTLTAPPEELLSMRSWQRSLFSGTSCGLCGKSALEAVGASVDPVPGTASISIETLLRLPNEMRRQQTLFQTTGGLHAAGIFDGAGTCRALFEDIGRHNATDKAIGRGLREGWLPWRSETEPLVLLVSGRASFEVVQKALVARLPVICSVSAASSLACDLASANNQALVGFVRDTGLTVYAGQERILAYPQPPPDAGRD
jgi:FdhD protein